MARFVAAIIILVAVALIFFYQLKNEPLSEDAMLQADVVHISTPVPGRVEQFHVTENGMVKRGELLFTLDPTVYRLRVAQAEAELKSAMAARDLKQRQIKAELSNVTIANEQVERALSNLSLTEKTLERLIPLNKKGYVTTQQVDDARTLYQDAQVSLRQARAQAQAAENLVGNMEAADALVEVAQSALAIAQRALADTEVSAPHDGLIVGLSVSSGEYVAPDQSLFTLINTEQWYATAFFRETELSELKPNACAVVYALADPSVAIKGKVDSIGWGISSTDMIDLPRVLPIVQKSLNWVRVAQRFPVRVRLENAPENLLRIGASAVVVVKKHDDDC
ncbi:multidrug transporter subunit MdtN [Advenella sp. RU8]|uniref:multidrug transporter subunit MdtN n=1 Tax=Advenella sp. RU8 TaxID=3399575 RepID=UPI003AADEC7D